MESHVYIQAGGLPVHVPSQLSPAPWQRSSVSIFCLSKYMSSSWAADKVHPDRATLPPLYLQTLLGSYASICPLTWTPHPKLFWAPMLQCVLLPGHHSHPLSCAHLCTSNPQLPVPHSIWILTLQMYMSLHMLLLQVYVTAYVTCPQ